MAYLNSNVGCCGILELCEILGTYPRTPQKILKDCYEDFFIIRWNHENQEVPTPSARFVLFSDIGPTKTGNALMKYIQENKLGTVVKIKSATNPNTGNLVSPYIWTVQIQKFQAWGRKNVKS